MEGKKVKAIEDIKGLCFKCLEKKNVSIYSLYRSDYGSSFDNLYTHLQICDDCKPKDIDIWFNEEPTYKDYYTDYKYEDNIIDFVKTFPLEGQELFWNKCAYGASAHTMDSQDWIDMELGILPDEKYKEYCMHSPSEIKAYEERFPNCKQVNIKIYSDGSKGSYCFRSAFGDEEGNCGCNTSDKCYLCDYYEERVGEIKVINELEEYYKNETERLIHMIQYANKRLEMIENKTLKID